MRVGHGQFAGDAEYWLNVPIATLEVVDITGITQDETDASVEFTWEWFLGEHAEFFIDLRIHSPSLGDDQLHEATANFKNYDDGWRFVDGAGW